MFSEATSIDKLVPYVSEGLWRGFLFSRLAASAAARAANADLPNDH